jgi:hypothetical protein
VKNEKNHINNVVGDHCSERLNLSFKLRKRYALDELRNGVKCRPVQQAQSAKSGAR